MKKTIQLILEFDNEENAPLEWIKKDLTSQINSAGFYYEVKECVEIEPHKNKNDKLISQQAAIDAAVQSLMDWDGVFIQEANCRIRNAISELPSAQPVDKDINVPTNDTISRQAAIELAMQYCPDDDGTCSKADEDIRNLLDELESLPSAQPEIKPIEYRDCANAMQRMWMDNVVTDGEYYRIMDKLNAHWRKKNEQAN